jgi:glycine cleavage system H protein
MSPEDLLYTKEHEWLRVDGALGVVGITNHAQRELGDVVYVDLPKVGDRFEAGQTFGSVESVKAVSELFLPVAGEIVDINEDLGSSPEALNEDPYNKGWLVKIRIQDSSEISELMSNDKYDSFVDDEEE